ncbi:DNA-binding MarR family transcriptional regulator [Catenuloplanes nepalensis]|uniref:DNA-binding MarR family transcriptional regulator n=1 Tax=Catenuloplanes nepalensis TaxID=587533 RepID=A0ABT9MR69_9ACTN|nr:MarR family transcriptional regulator [Catenuloplanes nepalensis]MDP9793929.1 DNA-binding MarR family transcriptional regulator [Catenuloplanes nepalensis]
MAAEDLAARLLDHVMLIAEEVSGRMREALDRLDLTEPTAELLWHLRPDAEPASLRTLASRLHCDPSNITLRSAKLEAQGLAVRRPHPADGRIRTLVLTEAGVRMRRLLLEAVAERSPLAGLNAEEQRQLDALLSRASVRR